MHNVKDLIELAKSASSKFLSKTASLNDSILKDVSGKEFSDEEIRRIVEFANTNTYLELRKSAENRYVNFEVADFNTIKEQMPKTQTKEYVPSTHSDYINPPTPQIENVVEKTAEVISTKVEYDFLKDIVPTFTKEIRKYANAVEEDLLETDGRVNKLTNSVRQILLEGGDTSSVKTLFTMVDPGGTVWNQVSEKLQNEFPVVKTAEFIEGKIINPDTDLVKEARAISFLVGRAVENAIYLDMLKYAFAEEEKIYKEATLNKVVGGLGVGIAGITAFGLGSRSANAAQKQKELYKLMKPKGALV